MTKSVQAAAYAEGRNHGLDEAMQEGRKRGISDVIEFLSQSIEEFDRQSLDARGTRGAAVMTSKAHTYSEIIKHLKVMKKEV